MRTLLAILLLCSSSLRAAEVTLAWNANTDPVAGYRLHYGSAAGAYTTTRDVGSAITAAVKDLIKTGTYYFAVSAYSADGLESDPCLPVKVGPWPVAPTGMKIVVTITRP